MGFNEFALTLILHNQGHSRVCPMFLTEPKYEVHGIYPTTRSCIPWCECGSELGVTSTHGPTDMLQAPIIPCKLPLPHY